MQSPLKIEPATGLLADIRQVLSPFDARPTGVLPELIVVHGISMPPGEFGGPWIDRLFTGNLPPDAHPFFKETSKLRVSAHALIRGMEQSFSTYRSASGHGMPGSRTIAAVPAATTFQSVSSSKVRARSLTPMPNTISSRRWSRHW